MEPVKLWQKRVAPALPFRPRFGLHRYQEGLWNLPEFYMQWPFDFMEWGVGLALCRSKEAKAVPHLYLAGRGPQM